MTTKLRITPHITKYYPHIIPHKYCYYMIFAVINHFYYKALL